MVKKPPVRFWVAIMIFFTVFTTYVIRLHFNILIVAMVTHKKSNLKPPACDPTKNMSHYKAYNGPKFKWNEYTQGHLIGAYNYGFIFTNVVGGVMAEWWGPKKVIFWSNVVSGVLTLVTGYSARVHYALVFVIRFVLGVMGGVLYPAVQCLLSNWAPPQEKGKFVALLMGNTIGSVVCLPLMGFIAQKWDFDAAYVTSGVFVLVYCAIFYAVVSDRPQNHWFISDTERDFILQAQEGTVSEVKRIAPFRRIASNCPFLAACIGHFGNMWGIFFQMTMVPKFCAEVLGFNLKSAGFLSALPYLGRFFSGLAFGFIGDFIKKRKLLKPTTIRRSFALSSHIIPGILVGLIVIAKCRVTAVVALLVVSLMFNGAVTLTVLQAPHDLAPNFAGTLYGVMQTVAAPPGFIIPLITAEFIKKNNGIHEWSWIYLVTSLVYLITGVVYVIWLSGNLQPFNEGDKEETAA